jgi:hypothetical protein
LPINPITIMATPAAHDARNRSDGLHQRRRVVRLRRHGQHEEIESKGNDDEHEANDDDPPVFLSHIDLPQARFSLLFAS